MLSPPLLLRDEEGELVDWGVRLANGLVMATLVGPLAPLGFSNAALTLPSTTMVKTPREGW